MSAVFASRIARRRAIAYVALLAAALVLMAVSANPLVVDLQRGIGFAFKPASEALAGLGRDVSSIFAAIGEIDRLRLDNEALRAENEQIRTENRQAEELRRENELLTGLLQLRNGFEYETVAATVIARESSEVQRRIVLDRGTADGIEIGDVVIASGGALVGRVVDAGATSSTIQLISDSASTVIGQLLGTAATGEVTGQLPGSLLMENIDSTVVVGLGEEVVTAGIELAGGIRSPYPKGLVIGRVIDVRRDANEIVQTAYIEPAAALDRLEYVLVILDYQGGLPPPEQQPTDCEPGDEGTLPDGEQPCIEATPTPAPSGSAAP
ncbi:MAG TPA: rod shape-determining protein MreC [Candidatus Limnocylindrales bacterium]|nr:rod shape-determining protein MreC [Candidatus Limnocylindrales bacterium]